jgi:hypothetical protein
MANEIRITENVQIVNGSFRDTFAPGTIQVTQAASGGGNPGTVSIGTSEEDVAFGDVTPSLLIMQNLDGTNFVKYGPKSAGSMIEFGRLAAGKTTRLFLAPGVTLRMIADTGACKVLIKGYNA